MSSLACILIHIYILPFLEGDADRFTVGLLEGPFRVGVPFNIPLDLQDSQGNPARIDPAKTDPKHLTANLVARYALW